MTSNLAVLQALDIFFLVFHTLIILFNCLGWIHPKTRPWNLGLLLLTAASWFILGIWYGWGYCPCTDWHWQVRSAMGRPIETTSYIKFLIETLTGADPNRFVVDAVTVGGLFVALGASITLNILDWRRRSPRRMAEA